MCALSLAAAARSDYHDAHPGERPSDLGRRVPKLEVVQHQGKTVAWKCEFCNFGILQSPHCSLLCQARKLHRAKAHPRLSLRKWTAAQQNEAVSQKHLRMLKRAPTFNESTADR